MEVSKSEINNAFQFFTALLEERKSELLRELEGIYSSKQVAMSVYSQKEQENVDKIFQVSERANKGRPSPRAIRLHEA